MNNSHFHELQQVLLDDPRRRVWIQAGGDEIAAAMRFDLGDAGALQGLAHGSLHQLKLAPSAITATEVRIDGFVQIMVHRQMAADPSKHLVTVYRREPSRVWTDLGSCRIEINEDDTAKLLGVDDPDWIKLLVPILVLYRLLKCVNVTRQVQQPPAPLNKKRQRNGKLPLLSYHTLHLVAPNSRVERQNLGGTHAAPRLHVRRGHIRTRSDGREIWVREHLIGSKHGMVLKDYRVHATGAAC